MTNETTKSKQQHDPPDFKSENSVGVPKSKKIVKTKTIWGRLLLILIETILFGTIGLLATLYINIKKDNQRLIDEKNVLVESNNILIYNITEEDKEFLTNFFLPQKGVNKQVSFGQINQINGSFKNTFSTRWDIYPVVRGIDGYYYPNKKIILPINDTIWKSYVWVGGPNNNSGDSFSVFYVAVRPNLSREFARLEEKDGRENIGRNLPPGVFVLGCVEVNCKLN